MHITEFKAENIKRLKAVRIEPGKGPVIIGGNNAQGKTSVLDAIEMALGGKDSICDRPIRDGKSSAFIVLETEEFTITRKFTASGATTLTVTSKKDGMKQPSPQGVLDALTAKISFDPLAFIRMKPSEQAGQLRQLVGLDLSDLEDAEKQAYDSRTIVNREVEREKQLLDSMPLIEDAPSEEVSIAGLNQQFAAAIEQNTANDQKRRAIAGFQARIDDCASEIGTEQATIDMLKERLAQAEARKASYQERSKSIKLEMDAAEKAVEALKDVDTTEIKKKIESAEIENQKVRKNAEREKVKVRWQESSAASRALTEKIDGIKGQKQKRLAAVKYPVEGISLESGEVQFGSVPLNQASSAEQLRVSIAIACAMNPTLKVMLVRDGSLLDESSMKLLLEQASEAGAQVWMEVVGKRSDCSVIIEDGEVQE